MNHAEIFNRIRSIKNLNSEKTAEWLLDLSSTLPVDQWCCEVGTYFGYISSALAVSGRKVIMIDHMLCGFCDIAPNSRCLYEDVIENFRRVGAWNLIMPFPMKSVDAIPILKVMEPVIGVLYLDGDHSSRTVLMELKEMDRFIPVGGAVCGDDCTMASNISTMHNEITFNSCWSAGKKEEFCYKLHDYGGGVALAVWEFFRDNPSYEAISGIPANQFGFRKVA